MTAAKSNGYHLQIAWLRWTSSWCSICLHPGQNRKMLTKLLRIPKSGCPGIWIRLPQHKWPKSWSGMEDPVVPLERNLYGRPSAGLLWERQCEKILLEHGWVKVPNWECLFVHREKGLFLSVCVDDIKLAGKKQKIDPIWKVRNEQVDSGEPPSFFDHFLWMHSKTMRNKQIHCGQSQNHVRIQSSRRRNGKSTKLGKTEYFDMVPRYGRSCKQNARNGVASWLAKRLSNFTKSQLLVLMTVNSKKKDGNPWENCQTYALKLFCNVCIWHALVDLIFYGQSTNLHVRSQKLDQGMWQTSSTFDLLHSFHKWLQTALSCWKQSTTMQIGTVSRLRFCRRSWRFEIDFRWNVVYFWQSLVCSKKLGCVRKRRQFHTVQRNLRLFLLMQVYEWTVFPALDLWDLVIDVLHSKSNQTHRNQLARETRCITKRPRCARVPRPRHQLLKKTTNYQKSILFPHFSSGRPFVHLWGQRGCDKEDCQKEKSYNETCFQDPQSCSWLVVRVSLDWTPRSKSNMSTPKTNSQTFWPKGTSHVMNGIIFSFSLLNISIFSSSSCSQAMSKRMQEGNGKERTAPKSKPMVDLVSSSMAESSTVPSSTTPTGPVSLRANSHGLGVMVRGKPVVAGTGKPDASDSNQIQNSQSGTGKPVAWDSVIEIDLETPQEYETSVESIPLMERVHTRLRIMMNRHPGDRMEDLDKHSLMWWMFVSRTMNATVFLGEDFLDKFRRKTL